jgi:hypothetical protein
MTDLIRFIMLEKWNLNAFQMNYTPRRTKSTASLNLRSENQPI